MKYKPIFSYFCVSNLANLFSGRGDLGGIVEWCITSRFTALPIAEWGVMHTVHDAFFAFKAFLGQDFTGQGCCPGLAVPVRFLAALCALDTGSGYPVSGSRISPPCHSFCKWKSVPFSVRSVPDILLSACQCSSLLS